MASRTTFFTPLESPGNSLALNKDNSQVAVSGRNIFKIFQLQEEKFVETFSLRVGKTTNMNYSCNDVVWNQIEENILATASTNGVILIWDMNRGSRSKQKCMFSEHTRTVNKINFHATEPSWLISGSQDGTIKCFDFRSKDPATTFVSNTESVRDVQFSPQQPNTFAAVSENGHVQMWDVRRPERCFQDFTAHSGPIFACEWHPETSWIATASRDKTIKVWDLTTKPSCDYTIHTLVSVGRIKWRPNRKYQIASCSLLVDYSINVWDIRRPYIPFAIFEEHTNSPLAIIWRGDPQSLLSSSRDQTLYHHVFKDAARPINKANPQGIALNIKGDIAYACKAVASTPNGIEHVTSKIIKKPSLNNSDTFCKAISYMHRFTSATSNSSREFRWFKMCAENYILHGNLNDICDHNAVVAKNAGRNDVSTVWSIIKTCFKNPFGSNINSNSNNNNNSTTSKRPISDNDIASTLNIPMTIGNTSEQTNFENDIKSLQGESALGMVSGGDDETEMDEPPENQNFIGPFITSRDKPTSAYKRQPKGDFSFGESELEPLTIEYNSGFVDNMIIHEDNDNDWSLPKEAFPIRHEIQNRSPPPEQFPNHSPDINDDLVSVSIDNQPCQFLVTSVPKPAFWDPTSLIEDTLRHHADMKDIQTTVCILMALGDKRKNLNIEPPLQEHWLFEYLDMLGRFRLWEVATRIIRQAWLPSISQLNQQSTTVYVCCTLCTKALTRSAWVCDRCRSSNHALCTICHQVVKGTYVWCQACAHGGHLAHLRDWFSVNKQCPTGCGHMCEYV
ncbi:GATOR complex protein WDR24 [Copidosoma floridanum]|uniref:GATOR complex protein WDR24 n=1 Tax=Copidosoma floridanum TaxID=29053 RepID=UPI0006C99204|nr:GATOR complex protein WDR24 [Copidosoma floridanum]